MNCILSLLLVVLPIVRLTGNFGHDYSEATVDLITETDTITGMRAKVKWRGGSTNRGDKHKRNYNVKFLDEDGEKQNRSFFGFRSDNHWNLCGALDDYARIRNLVCTELWLDMARKPYYSDREPNALSGARARLVELYINDEYRGIYTFGEIVDRKQMKLKKYKNDTFRGMLWKGMHWTSATMMHWGVPEYDDSSAVWHDMKLMYPDIDEVCPTDWHVIHDAGVFVDTSSYEEFDDSVATYFDLPVLIDYFIFLNVIFGADNCGKNMFWACYDQSKDKKLTLAVWDLDVTFGQSTNAETIRPERFGPEKDFMRWNNLYVLTRLRYYPHYRQMIYDRYKELRRDIISPDSLYARFSNYYDMLDAAGAIQREEEKWSGDSDLAGNVLDISDEMEFIRDYIYKRMKYLDNYMSYYNATAEINETLAPADDDDRMYDLSGRRIWEIPAKGIYIRNGRKYVR